LLVATGFVAPFALPVTASATDPASPPQGTPLGVVRVANAPAATRPVTTAGANNLLYHGGAVMRTNTTYAVYWFPAGSTFNSTYQSTINGFLQNVAAASRTTGNVYASDTQYSDTTGPIAYSSTYGGAYVDTAAFPTSGCHDLSGHVCLTDAQIATEVARAVSAAGWTPGPNKLFFLMTPKNVDSCFDSTSQQCAFTYYCAYHSWIGSGSSALLYANMPYGDTVPAACDWGEHPNGGEADATINVLSHEHNEAITDPQGSAWYDSQGEENGDKCAWTFGTPLGSTGTGQYNQAIGTGKYWLQQEWSNAISGCVLAYPAPTVGAPTPGTGQVGTQVTVPGSHLTGANTVKFNNTAASFTVNSDSSITATVPAGATTGPVSVTTPGGTGSTSSSFVVIAPPSISSFNPNQGSVGTSVTISGKGFTGTSQVKFNGTPATYTVKSDTQIAATVPAGATTGPVQVTNPTTGTATSTGSFKVQPKITGFTPPSGPVGTLVTITGSGFTGATQVKFGPQSASFTVVNDSQITATVPAKASSSRIQVTTTGGNASTSSNFTVTH
jgi:hypothetical protein